MSGPCQPANRKYELVPNLLYAFPEPLPLHRARGLQVVKTVHALAEQGVRVTLCHVPGDGEPFVACNLVKPECVTLVPLSRCLPWPLGGIHSNRLFAARLIRRLIAHPADTIMVRHLKIARSLLAAFPHVPLLYEAHEVYADTVTERRRARTADLEGEVVRKAQAVVANSRATASRLTRLYGLTRAIEVIPNGADYKSVLPPKDWSRAAERVVYAGSFFGWKGVDDLVVASRELPGVRITLLGGDEEAVRRMQAQTSTGGAQLEFPGRVSPKQVAETLERACIAVLPNRASADSDFTSPIKLFEYMAAGCAIVASDLPAVREILGDDEAAWARPGDPASLAAAIRALVNTPGRASELGRRVREKSQRYTWAARAERLKRSLERVQRNAR